MTFDEWWFTAWNDKYNMASCTVLMKSDNDDAIEEAENLWNAAFEAGYRAAKAEEDSKDE